MGQMPLYPASVHYLRLPSVLVSLGLSVAVVKVYQEALAGFHIEVQSTIPQCLLTFSQCFFLFFF